MTALNTMAVPTSSARKAARLCAALRPERSSLTRPFKPLGRMVGPVTVAREGTLWRLGRWLALNRTAGATSEALWRACQAANPECFKTYAIVRLDQPSFFLPAGESAFEHQINPVQIPESPPQGVMMRHWEAMEAHPLATFYYLSPVFTREPRLRLYPADELRAEARGDRRDAMTIARYYGWAFRANAWRRRRTRDAAFAAARTAARVADTVTRRPRLLRRGAAPRPAGTLEELIRRAERDGRTEDAVRYRRSLEEIRRLLSVDPILCFEKPGDPGRLWFEAHWYLGEDGRTYVHY